MFSLAVCDPLSRRYVLIPPMPEDLAVPEEKLLQIKSMLAPIGEDDDEMSFKVIYLAFHRSQLVAFVFSSMTGHWCISASLSWTSLGKVHPIYDMSDDCNHLHGYVYWTGLWSERDKLLVLDTRSMEFSTVNFRTGYHTQLLNRPHLPRCHCYVVAGRGEEALEVFSLVADQNTECSLAVHHSIQKNNDESSMEWQLEKIIPLPGKYFRITSSGVADGFLFLRARMYTEDALLSSWLRINISSEEHIFSLDVHTSETTEVCRKRPLCNLDSIYSYFGFPPSLSKPSM
uniref:Uncharacterized protein n=1 Tax=Avena sativa TaxID=4498 RepID=A0ACD5YIV1_AVESA